MDTPTTHADDQQKGLPLWMPLLGLLVALCFTVFVGVRVFPTLGALLFPPQPPLPTSGEVRLLLTESKGLGKDEWLYGTDLNACEVMRYYADLLGDCKYDPAVNCSVGTGVGLGTVGRGVRVKVAVGVAEGGVSAGTIAEPAKKTITKAAKPTRMTIRAVCTLCQKSGGSLGAVSLTAGNLICGSGAGGGDSPVRRSKAARALALRGLIASTRRSACTRSASFCAAAANHNQTASCSG